MQYPFGLGDVVYLEMVETSLLLFLLAAILVILLMLALHWKFDRTKPRKF